MTQQVEEAAGPAPSQTAPPLVDAQGVKKHFAVGRGVFSYGKQTVKAVDGVDFEITEGETFCLAGESGCGKTTLANLLLKLERPTDGMLRWQGAEIDSLTREETRAYRRNVQAVFQDPWSSLNSKLRVGHIIAEPLVINQRLSKQEINDKVASLLEQVTLSPVHAERYPHEFSGGQRQRIAIARALGLAPKMLVLDEPVSALDVSIRAQIVNLLKDLQAQLGLTFFVISHDLSMVRYMADTVAIMYLGKFAEMAPSEEFFNNPLHPYSRALLSATLSANPARPRERIVLQGEVPSPISPPSGCRFRTRCPHVMDICAEVEPAMKEAAPGHRVACHLY